MATDTNKATQLPAEAKAYNGVDRNAWVFFWLESSTRTLEWAFSNDRLYCLPTLGSRWL